MARIDIEKLGLLLRTIDNINQNSRSGPLANVNWVIRESKLSYVFVYRTLDKLADLKVIEKVSNPDNGIQFLIVLTDKGKHALTGLNFLLDCGLGAEK